MSSESKTDIKLEITISLKAVRVQCYTVHQTQSMIDWQITVNAFSKYRSFITICGTTCI